VGRAPSHRRKGQRREAETKKFLRRAPPERRSTQNEEPTETVRDLPDSRGLFVARRQPAPGEGRIDKGRKGPCLACIEKYDAEKNVVDLDELRRKLGPKQSSLFQDAT
jgi:hypothetical protein